MDVDPQTCQIVICLESQNGGCCRGNASPAKEPLPLAASVRKPPHCRAWPRALPCPALFHEHALIPASSPGLSGSLPSGQQPQRWQLWNSKSGLASFAGQRWAPLAIDPNSLFDHFVQQNMCCSTPCIDRPWWARLPAGLAAPHALLYAGDRIFRAFWSSLGPASQVDQHSSLCCSCHPFAAPACLLTGLVLHHSLISMAASAAAAILLLRLPACSQAWSSATGWRACSQTSWTPTWTGRPSPSQ